MKDPPKIGGEKRFNTEGIWLNFPMPYSSWKLYKCQMPLNKINLMVTAMAVLMLV